MTKDKNVFEENQFLENLKSTRVGLKLTNKRWLWNGSIEYYAVKNPQFSVSGNLNSSFLDGWSRTTTSSST